VASYQPVYENSWALIIGIDHYETLSPLSYAMADAQSFADLLVHRYGYDADRVFVLLDEDANQVAIREVLDETLSNPDVVGEDDRVIIFFAGHGVTRHGHRGNVGYIAPVEAHQGQWHSYIPMDYVTGAAQFIPAKHIFFIIDACYSGLSVMRGGATLAGDRVGEDLIRQQAWQILTAGRETDRVSDGGGPYGQNSLFTGYLLEGLRGKAADERGVISASSLMYYVYEQVNNEPRADQTPVYGWLRGDGDYIFQTALPDNIPDSLAGVIDGPTLLDRLNAVGELSRMCLANSEQEFNNALELLTFLAERDVDQLVRTTAAYVLNEVQQIYTSRTSRRQHDTQPLPEHVIHARLAEVRGTNGSTTHPRPPEMPHYVTEPEPVVLEPPPPAPEPTAPDRRARGGTRWTTWLAIAALMVMLVAIGILLNRSLFQDQVISELQSARQTEGAILATFFYLQNVNVEATAAQRHIEEKARQATAMHQTTVSGVIPTATLLPSNTLIPSDTPTEAIGATVVAQVNTLENPTATATPGAPGAPGAPSCSMIISTSIWISGRSGSCRTWCVKCGMVSFSSR
jgi:hypothetical protein